MYKVGFRKEAVMKVFEGRISKGQKTTFFIRPTKKLPKVYFASILPQIHKYYPLKRIGYE